jgi:hypothetical protein
LEERITEKFFLVSRSVKQLSNSKFQLKTSNTKEQKIIGKGLLLLLDYDVHLMMRKTTRVA